MDDIQTVANKAAEVAKALRELADLTRDLIGQPQAVSLARSMACQLDLWTVENISRAQEES